MDLSVLVVIFGFLILPNVLISSGRALLPDEHPTIEIINEKVQGSLVNAAAAQNGTERFEEKMQHFQLVRDDQLVHEYASLLHNNVTPYHAAMANFPIPQPYVEWTDISLAGITVCAGAECIQVGWKVQPRRHGGDTRPHMFVLFRNETHECYDTYCPNIFVSMNNVERWVEPTGLEDVRHVSLFREQPTGEWHALFDGAILGHWPLNVLPRLRHGGTIVRWGGEVITPRRPGRPHSNTLMGSGRFPNEGLGSATYMSGLAIKSEFPGVYQPPLLVSLAPDVTRPGCYNLMEGRIGDLPVFYFGGPGRNPQCH